MFEQTLLVINGLVALWASGESLRYYVKWRNGKKYLSIVIFVGMLYPAVLHLLAGFHLVDPATYGGLYLRPFLPAIYLFLVFHARLDSERNKSEHIHKGST